MTVRTDFMEVTPSTLGKPEARLFAYLQDSLVRCVHLVNCGTVLVSSCGPLMTNKPNSRSIAGHRTPAFPPVDVIFGRSQVMQSLRQKIEKAASSGVPILIQGDSGTGKGVLALYIHGSSGQPESAFIKVNCAAIPGALLESELFGYEKGAFTGAHGVKPGRVELADGGTLFLDGIDDIDMSLQAKLLQLLQDGQFSRIGGQEDRKVQIRVICATNRHLEDEIAEGRFRRDLFYRINVVSLEVPTLRARSEDIRDLAGYFLENLSARHNVPARPLSPAAMSLLQKHPWTGNIRELRNVVERLIILGDKIISGKDVTTFASPLKEK